MTVRPPGWPRRLARAPLLQFLVLGSALFAVRASVQRPEPLRVAPAQVRALADEYRTVHGRPPDADELQSMVDEWVDEELTVTAAYGAGFPREDSVIRRRLIRKMKLLSDDPTAEDTRLIEQALAMGLERSDPIVRRRLVYLMEQRWTSGAPSAEARSDRVHRELARLRRHRGVVVEQAETEGDE